MITIEENTPKKIPGLTSLFITFNYKKEIVDIFKDIEVKNFDKKIKTWEIPATSLSYFIDKACYWDDIDLYLLKDKEKKEDKRYKLLDYKIKPFKHQEEAIQYGLNHNKWLLLDTMGLGKSASVIHIAEELKARGKIDHCLIICGINSLKSNWAEEINKHSNLSSIIIGRKINKKGTVTAAPIPERVKQLKEKIKEFFVIINVESLRSKDILDAIIKGKNNFDMIAIDEIHKCNNDSSLQGSNILKCNKAKYQIGMTGTLLLNDPIDVYMPLKWIGVEKCPKSNFKYYYYRYGGPFNNQVIGFKNLDILKEQINENSLRRTKDLLDLPEKNIIVEYLDMEEDQAKFYNDVKKGVKEEVDKVKLNTTNLLALVTRLRQATSNPSILTTSNIDSVKINRAVDLTEQLLSNNNKVVIFTKFIETANKLYEILKNKGASLNTGETSDEDFNNNRREFQNNEKARIFIGTTGKCGTGITLTAAHYMIFIDTPWTFAEFDQCCDRIHRIGAKENVFIYELLTKNTVDERVHDILQNKKAISDYIVDDVISEDTIDNLKKYIEELD